jgi:Ser/Thr protein kinase RdoA (MazF antagonist)
LGALAAGPPEPVVPEVLLCDVEAHLVALSEVPGEPLRGPLLSGDLETSVRAGAAIGAWHRAWQDRAPDALVPHTLDRELEILRARVEQAPAAVRAAVGGAIAAIADGEWEYPTVVHRDLYEDQVLVGDRIGLIDLDDVALGPPELDVGNLLAHVDLLALRSETNLSAPADALLDGYRHSGPSLDAALLARCRALTLLRLACIHADLSLIDGARAPLTAALDGAATA